MQPHSVKMEESIKRGRGAYRAPKGQGSDRKKTLGRWVTDASGYNNLQDGFVKHLSIRSNIISKTSLRLDKVNFGPENTKSNRLQESKHSLNFIALLRFIFLPPNLSSLLSTSLKSPNNN